MTGLPRQVIPITFSGLDTKTDPKALMPGKLTELNNAVITAPPRIDKRFGHTALSNSTANEASGTMGATATRLAKHAGGLLKVEMDGYGLANVMTQASAADRWLPVGKVSSCSTEVIPLDTGPVGYSVNGVEANGYYIGGGHEKIVISDVATGKVIRSVTLTGSNGFRFLKSGNYVYAIYSYSPGSLIRAFRFDTSSPTFLSFDATAHTSLVTASGELTFDVIMPSSTIYLVYKSAANTTAVATFDNALASISSTTVTTTGDPSRYCAVWDSDNSRIFVGYAELTGSNFEYFVRAADLTSVKGVTEFGTTATSAGNGIAGIYRGSGEVVFVFNANPGFSSGVKFRRVNATAAVGSVANVGVVGTSDIAFGVSLCQIQSDAVSIGGGYWAMAFYNGDSTQPCTFLVRLSFVSDVASIETLGRTVVDRAISGFCRPSLGADGAFLLPLTYSAYAVTGFYSTVLGFCLTRTNLNRRPSFCEAGKYTYFTGGFISCFDGENVVEDNFLMFPDASGAATATTGGNLANVIYDYVVVYEWIDSLGVFHQSKPSPVFTVDHSGSGTQTNRSTISVGTTPFTRRFGDAARARAVVYRNEGSGSETFYRVDDFQDFPEIDGSFVTYSDTASNASLLSQPRLYTDGFILENACPPPSDAIAFFKGRLWLGAGQDIDRISYSKVYQDGQPVYFATENTIDVEANSTKQVMIAPLADKIVSLKSDRIHVSFGQGPDNAGNGGNFAPFELLPANTGLEDAGSVILTDRGLIYKAAKGFMLLDYGLNAGYIGGPVEEYNSYEITSACLVPNENKVRFTTRTGPRLTYDYELNLWTVDTSLPAWDAVEHAGAYHMLYSSSQSTNASQVYKESTSVYTDNSTDYLLSFTTGWLSFAGFSNLQRVYRLQINGERYSTASIRVSVGYDYATTWEDIVTIAADTALTDGLGGYKPFVVQVNLKKQKCQALRFRFEELSPGGTKQGLSVSSVGLEVGLKQGTTKLRAAQVSGAS